MINELSICVFGQDEILFSRPIDMDHHSIKNVISSVNKVDAINKAYADRIKYKTATCNIPNTVMTRPYTLHLSCCESFCKVKDKHM